MFFGNTFSQMKFEESILKRMSERTKRAKQTLMLLNQ